MRSSYITPRVSDAVVEAREALAKAMRAGAVRDIDTAYQRLDTLDNAARRRRISAHHVRIVTRTLGTPDLAWDRFTSLVADFRR